MNDNCYIAIEDVLIVKLSNCSFEISHLGIHRIMKKDRYLQIFNYLKEFSKIRTNPVRDIELQEAQYPEKIWLFDLPENENVENVIRPDFNQDNEYLLKITKPLEPKKPAFPKLNKSIEKWVDTSTLLDEEGGPKLHDTIEIDGEAVSSHNVPIVQKEFLNYIENRWIDDVIDYKLRYELYKNEYDEFEKTHSIYKRLFRLSNKIEQFGEEYELVIGIGLLNFKYNEGPSVFRHVVTQKVDISFEATLEEARIIIAPNPESELQIETDAIRDLTDQFDSLNISDAEELLNDFIRENEIETAFDNLMDGFQKFAAKLSPDGIYDNSLAKPNSSSNKPVISYSPALLLRKRNTQTFTALFEKILENIEQDDESIEIPSMDDLIGETNDVRYLQSNQTNESLSDEIIYFPKEYNAEQLEIVEKTRVNRKVLVQGPPGTGKSHTISNLICHLLANGNRVLVTASTKRALEVLKDKLPPEFQNLTVNLLSGDSSSINDLQASVNAIVDELSNASLPQYRALISEHEQALKKTKKTIAEISNELAAVKEKATREQKINMQYEGTLTQIAERLEKEAEQFDWYKDDCSQLDAELIENLATYLNSKAHYENSHAQNLHLDLPSLSKLLTAEQLSYLARIKSEARDVLDSIGKYVPIRCANYELVLRQLNILQDLYAELDTLQVEFLSAILQSLIKGRSQEWLKKLNDATEIITKLEKSKLNQFDKDIEVEYPLEKSLKQIKNDAQILHAYLKGGNTLVGLSFLLKKPFLPREIKERLYFIDSVKVNGSRCDTLEEFEIVLEDIGWKQVFVELSELWEIKSPNLNSYTKNFAFYRQLQIDVQQVFRIWHESKKAYDNVKSVSDLEFELFDRSALERATQVVHRFQLFKNIIDFEQLLLQSRTYLKQQSFHPIAEEIGLAYDNLDYNALEQLRNRLNELIIAKNNLSNFEKIRSSISSKLPLTFHLIESKDFTIKSIEKLQRAICFRDAERHLEKLLREDYENKLVQDIKDLERKERKLIAQLAEKKAWFKVIEGLQGDLTLRGHLQAWAMAVKRIGKTGKGKRALKFRKIAQQEMEHCKKTVPCWIMPLYKVAETIHPRQEMYDYVIVDEASQLGPDALFLLYISKNIIIVGDDKQTSPEYIGLDANIMTPHIQRHLRGIPFSDYYGTEFSFFDHAKFFCNGVTVLREHFRCMPEIIEFSNKHFYAPDGKGLYPLKQFSENRLDPLRTVYCPDGYTEGTGARIINEPEAMRIADTIEAIALDKKYATKTIGVITLQGNQQASLIENLLLQRIGEKEFHERKIICGNSSSFQGDERDIIFLSLVTAHNHNRAPLIKPEDERRFNVAVSRAKEQIFLFHSVQLGDLGNTNDLRFKLLDHFSNYRTYQPVLSAHVERGVGSQPEPFDSWFEVDVYNDIVKRQYSVIPQYEVAKGRYKIDLVVLLNDGTKLAIECDGDRWHGPEQYQNDIMRQNVLERSGWQFFRIRGYEYYTNRQKALEPLWKMIEVFEERVKNQTNERHKWESESSHIISSDHKDDSDSSVEVGLKSTMEPSDSVGVAINNKGKVRYLNLHKTGVYILTDNEALNADYVIPIRSQDFSGYLLQFYNNGHINKVHMSSILSKRIGKEYLNGLNRDAQLIHVEVIASERIVGIFFTENGQRKFKAHLTENISAREQMHLQGYKVMYNQFDRIEYFTMPMDVEKAISRLVFQSFTAGGKAVANDYYSSEWATIKRYYSNQLKLNLDSNEPKASNSLGREVNLNSVVKLKYLNEGKELLVRLVDYVTNGAEVVNGIQNVYVKKPLARSILQAKVGDRVVIENTQTEIEIIHIQ